MAVSQAVCLTLCHTVITMSLALILTVLEKQGHQHVLKGVKKVSNKPRERGLKSWYLQGYASTYEKDKHYGERSYSISSKVEHIQTEIMTNGPVESAFRVYGDFPTYRSG